MFAPKYRRKVFYEGKKETKREIIRTLCEWKGVDKVGKNVKTIKEYISNQLKVGRKK